MVASECVLDEEEARDGVSETWELIQKPQATNWSVQKVTSRMKMPPFGGLTALAE